MMKLHLCLNSRDGKIEANKGDNMIKTVSECCGAKVKELPKNTLFLWGMPVNQYCSKCNKPCQIEKKRKTK